ncbi:MAG: hypothetical protein ABF289_20190 [Clostridiales bacterium]
MEIIKTDLKLMLYKKEFYIAQLIMFLLCFGNSMILYNNYYGKDISNVIQASGFNMGISGRSVSTIFFTIIYSFMFPLIVCLSYSDSYLFEKSKNINILMITRVNKTKYLLSKYLVIGFSGFLVIFIPYIINFLISFIVAPMYNDYSHSNLGSDIYIPTTENIIFPEIYTKYPYLESLIYVLIPSMFGSAIALTSYSISLLKKVTRLTVLILPTIIYNLYSFITAIFQGPYLSIECYLHPDDGLTGLSICKLLVIFIFLILLSFIPLMLKIKLNKDDF